MSEWEQMQARYLNHAREMDPRKVAVIHAERERFEVWDAVRNRIDALFEGT